MVAGDLLQLVPAKAVTAGITDVGNRYLVVAQQCHHQCGPHASVLRLAVCRLEDGGVGPGDDLSKQAGRQRGTGTLVQFVWRMSGKRFAGLARNQRGGDAAGDFAGIVATHSVRQHRQPDLRVGGNAVLVMRTHHSGVGGFRYFQAMGQVHFFQPITSSRSRPGTAPRTGAAPAPFLHRS